MNGQRHHSISLFMLLAFAVTQQVSAATISCDNSGQRWSQYEDTNKHSATMEPDGEDYVNLNVTCTAKVTSGEATSLEVVLGYTGGIVKDEFPCDGTAHFMKDEKLPQAWELFGRALMNPGAVVSGSFTVVHYNYTKKDIIKFKITDPRTETKSTTVDYEPSVALKGYASQTLTAPLINSITGNGTVTLAPGTADTSYGTLVNGKNKLEYSLDNNPAWAKKIWTLSPDTPYNLQVENINVPEGEYTGTATLTAECE